MLDSRVHGPARAVNPQIPQTRYEYQDALSSLPLTGAELRVLLYLLKCTVASSDQRRRNCRICIRSIRRLAIK